MRDYAAYVITILFIISFSINLWFLLLTPVFVILLILLLKKNASKHNVLRLGEVAEHKTSIVVQTLKFR